MKRLSIVLFVLFSLSTLFAQANKDYDGVKPEIYPGSTALVFTYTPFQSNLGALPATSVPIYDGNDLYEMTLGGIGLKYFLSNQISLVASLAFGSESFEQEIATNETEETSGSFFGIAVDVNYHLPNLYSISTYFGANINIGSLSADETHTLGTSVTKSEYSSSSFGFGLNIGFDWFFTSGMSLGGKYTFGYRSFSEPEMTYSSGTSSTTEKGPSSSAFGVGVGTIVLSVHF
ncbi:MAG: outer membrane beta-barrel protein [Melioribacteraceae bacterium]|nr:outer membrane beta-barrel protein [Melioribacteraceae bacterium]